MLAPDDDEPVRDFPLDVYEEREKEDIEGSRSSIGISLTNLYDEAERELRPWTAADIILPSPSFVSQRFCKKR